MVGQGIVESAQVNGPVGLHGVQSSREALIEAGLVVDLHDKGLLGTLQSVTQLLRHERCREKNRSGVLWK